MEILFTQFCSFLVEMDRYYKLSTALGALWGVAQQLACGEEGRCLSQKAQTEQTAAKESDRPLPAGKTNPVPPDLWFQGKPEIWIFYCCFPMFECWQVIQIIGPTLKANPNRSKGQIKGSDFQLVDLRSRPVRDLGLPAVSRLAVSAGSGKTPQHWPLAFPAIMWLFRCRYMKGFLEIGIYLFSISQEHSDMA